MPFAVDWLARRAELSPDRVALIDPTTGDELTFQAWNARANQTAHVLVDQLAIAAGDRVAVLASNSAAYLDVWSACTKVGAVLVNLNWRLTERELALQLGLAEPRVLLYSSELLPRANALRARVPQIADIALTERARYPTRFTSARLADSDPSVICFTGGTTGAPKGVVLTHGNIHANAINTIISWGITQEDVAILNAPLFHTGGLNVFTAPLIYADGTSIVCKGFDPDQVFDLIAGGKITLLFGVPTMFLALQEHPRWATADLSRLKLVISGGAPCPRPVFEKFWDRGVDFTTGYGLTEAGPNTFWLPRAQVRTKPGAVGYPLMHVEVRLVDGELHIRGPHVTPGYWNNPDATAAAIDTDGWLHTGDLAERDADGAYTIVGRKKDMFISGGENVYPAEIENVLAAHPAVAAVAVVSAPDPKWGEVGCALVVARTGHTVDTDALRDHCRANLAAYKVPKRFLVLTELPMTTVGKIDRTRLAALAQKS